MGRTTTALQSFNRGEVGRLALGRVDVEKLRLAAEEMVNWVPTTLGPMQFRPGTQYVGGILGDRPSVTLPFVYAIDDTALVEMTPGAMRVIVNDAPVIRPAVASTFEAGKMLTSGPWNVALTGNASVTIGLGRTEIAVPSVGGSASADAAFAVATPGVLHALRITVEIGPVTLRVGSTEHGNDLVGDTSLSEGVHSIAFVPGPGSAFVEFEVLGPRLVRIAGSTIEPAGEMQLATPYAASDLPNIRWDQSADVMFLACVGRVQRRIERRGNGSWSLVVFRPDDGPFRAAPSNVQLRFTGGVGQQTVLATRLVFAPSDVGRLIRAFTPDYNRRFDLGGDGAATPAVRISGVGVTRTISYIIEGSFTGHWQLERSLIGEDAGYAAVSANDSDPGNIEGDGPVPQTFYRDGFDNLVCWYRLRAVSVTAGAIGASLIHGGGGGRTAVARISGYVSPTVVNVHMIEAASSDTPTDDWSFGDWSDTSGYPTAVALYDGRLSFAGADRVWLSVSDAFNSFADTLADGTTVGDSSAISRSIGYGPVAKINWVLPLSRLLLGTTGSEVSIRSSALDAPLTPTGGLTLKDCSTLGSSLVPAVKCDTRGLFVQRSGQRLILLGYDVNSQDYGPTDLNRLHPDLCLGNPIVRLAVQRQPNTRIHCVRADGTVAVIIFEPSDEVQAWYRIEMTGGAVEDVVVLPDAIEDRVYYTVRRGTQRTRERFARLDEARGGALSKIADAHFAYRGAPIGQVTGLTWLEGQQVVIWADGKDVGTAKVTGGVCPLPAPASAVCVGIGYRGRWKSAKLAYAASGGTALNQKKRAIQLGLILADAHAQGLAYGPDFDNLDPMPLVEDAADIDVTGGEVAYDEQMISFPGNWNTDERLCLEAIAPRPCTVVAASLTMETSG